MTDPTPTLEQLLGLDTEGESGAESKPTGKDLRSQLTAVLAERKQLAAELATYRERDRARTVADLVTKHSIPALAQNLLLKEIGDADPTDEAVTKFVESYGELWGAKAAEASTTPEQQAATAAVQALTEHAGPPQMANLGDEDAYRSQFAEAKTRDDVMRMVAEATGGVQVRE